MKDHPADSFGLPFGLGPDEGARLLTDLRAAWVGMAKRPPGDLDRDLEWLFGTWFKPTITGGRLRTFVAGLPEAAADGAVADERLVVTIDGRRVVTPEGRVAIDLLSAATDQQRASVRSRSQNLLLEHYRRAGRHRLDDVAKHLAGRAGRMHPLTAGTLTFLLVNRATSPKRAIQRPKADDEQASRHLDEALAAIVSAFADEIRPGSRSRRHISLYSSWMLSELRRRLGWRIPDTDEIALAEGTEDFALEFLARDLAKGKLPTNKVAEAFDALVRAYRVRAPVLAEHGIDRERPAETARLRQRLIELYRRECPEC